MLSVNVSAGRETGEPQPGPPLRAVRSNPHLEAVQGIADTLRGHASHARDGNIYWRHPVDPVGPPIRPAPLGPHLYPGTVGIAFFLAAAARVLAEDGLRALSLQAILPLRREIREIARDPVRTKDIRHPIGGLTGLGSLVYALTRIGDLLEDCSLFEDAQAAAALITPDRIAADCSLDVMLGSAGAILGLLALDERLPGENLNRVTPLELAVQCARHLVAKRYSSHRFATLWLTPAGDSVPSGFCHGVAGIASALARLAERVHQPELREIAEQSLEYERALYVPAQRTWKITEAGEPRIVNSWCKGAPGIALGRLCMRKVCSDPLLDEEISNALETTGALPLSETDDLCCGNAGRVDVLVQAYRESGDPVRLKAARRLADGFLKRARRNGCYSLQLHGEIVLDPRLFSGLAGIGYSLLRLSATDLVPCVLAME